MCSQNEVVVIIAFKNEKFLMVYNPRRGWEFPGGKIRPNENPEEAAMRETMEEAGAKIVNLIPLHKGDSIVVFTAKIESLSDRHEFKRALFTHIPDGLAFPREEAERFLNMAKRMWR